MKFISLVIITFLSFSAFGEGTMKQKSEHYGHETKKMVQRAEKGPTQLDDLVRGELAAIKAYDQAIKDVKDPKQKATLQSLRKDHDNNAAILSKYVAGKPKMLEDTESAGAWGAFSKAWTKTRSFTGNEGAIKALRQGEEHGINEYQEALNDENLNPELKSKIKNDLLPKQQKHLETLNTLL